MTFKNKEFELCIEDGDQAWYRVMKNYPEPFNHIMYRKDGPAYISYDHYFEWWFEDGFSNSMSDEGNMKL